MLLVSSYYLPYVYTYRKRGKIRWTKLSQIPPNVVFTGILSRCLTLQHLNNAIIQSLYKDSRENFRGALENCEQRESLAQRIFPRLWCTVICIITKQVP